MSKRVITHAELEEELRVGTVDLSTVTVVAEAAAAGLRWTRPTPEALLANLKKVEAEAVATVPIDERAADAIEAADAEAAEEAALDAAEAE